MANAKIRVGVLGLTHDHVWGNLNNLVKHADAELVGAAEPDTVLRDRFQSQYGEKVIVSDYAELLNGRHNLQAVFIFADNRTSAELGAEAAARGLHVMLEKPMATNLELADRLFTAGQRYGVHVMINWPHNWNPKIRKAYDLVREGAIGDIYKLRYCAGHAGPREIGCSSIFCDWLYDNERNGAGALTDQAGYSATICRWFLGRPQRLLAMGGRLTKTDISDLDNVVILLRYDRAIAIAESSWSWVGGYPTSGPYIYGTEGSLVAHGARDPQGVTLITREDPQPVVVEAGLLPDGERNAPEYFISCIAQERSIAGLVSPEVSRDAQEILEAGIIAINAGVEVTLPLDRRLPGIGR